MPRPEEDDNQAPQNGSETSTKDSQGSPNNPDAELKEKNFLDKATDFVDVWFGHAPAVKPKVSNPNPVAEAGANPNADLSMMESGVANMRNVLDIDGDGDVDMDDLVAAMDAEVEGEEAEQMLAEYSPIFITLQFLVCVNLWLIGTMTRNKGEFFDFLNHMGGLETFVPGKTQLFVHKDCANHTWEVWRWITYQWTHANFLHILMNSLLLLLCGSPLEGFHGHLRIIFVFNLSVAGGALAHMVSRTHDAGLIGMSAGCYSLIGMHMADLAMNWSQNRWRKVKLFLLVLLIAAEVLISTLTHNEDDATGHSAHVGGFAAGLVLGILFARNLKVKMFERVMQVIALFIGIGLTLFCIIWITQWEPRSIWDPTPWCWAREMWSPDFFNNNEWHCIRCANQTCIDKWSSIEVTKNAAYQDCNQNRGWYNE